MNVPCKELKRRSRENLNRRYAIPMLAYLIPSALAALIELPFTSLQDEYATIVQTVTLYMAEFLIAILVCVLTFGECKIHLNIARRREFGLHQLFYCYRDDVTRYLLFSLLLTVVTLVSELPLYIGLQLFLADVCLRRLLLFLGLSLCSLVLIAIVQVNFRLLYYVALDHPSMPLRDALVTTYGLMRGSRGRLLYLYVSFCGMGLLALISLGLGWIWIEPYVMQTVTNFYLSVIGEYPPNPQGAP